MFYQQNPTLHHKIQDYFLKNQDFMRKTKNFITNLKFRLKIHRFNLKKFTEKTPEFILILYSANKTRLLIFYCIRGLNLSYSASG